jgi:hypothetical protein
MLKYPLLSLNIDLSFNPFPQVSFIASSEGNGFRIGEEFAVD